MICFAPETAISIQPIRSLLILRFWMRRESLKGCISTSNMDAVIRNQLDRIETALNALIDSITSYNPSIHDATDLLAADDELNNGVEQCKSSLYTEQDCRKLIIPQW